MNDAQKISETLHLLYLRLISLNNENKLLSFHSLQYNKNEMEIKGLVELRKRLRK